MIKKTKILQKNMKNNKKKFMQDYKVIVYRKV